MRMLGVLRLAIGLATIAALATMGQRVDLPVLHLPHRTTSGLPSPAHQRTTCDPAASHPPTAGAPVPPTTGTGTPPAAGTGAPPAAGTGVVTAAGHGWSRSTGLDGPVPAACTCRSGSTAQGQPLPDPGCTPGAIDPAVTDQNAATTVCRPGGYTSSVRPPASLTAPVKRALLAAYGIPAAEVSRYDLDHLIPLNAGGASDVRNLWPIRNTRSQFPAATAYHNDKAVVEYYVFTAMCQRRTTPSAVRAAMATDWTTAVARLGLPPIPANYQG